MGKRVLYVGGLSESVTNDQLRVLFGAYGVVGRAYLVRHKRSTQSAGYGLAEMASAEQALHAAIALEGPLLAGTVLRLYVTPYSSQMSSSPF